jgi:hypothetical protein
MTLIFAQGSPLALHIGKVPIRLPGTSELPADREAIAMVRVDRP